MKNSTPSLPSLHLEHLFQEIHFQHFVIYTKRDGFLQEAHSKRPLRNTPRETNDFPATERGSEGVPGPDAGAPAAWGLGAGTPCEVTVLAKTRQVGK